MYSSELNFKSFKSDSRLSLHLQKNKKDLKELDFHQQSFYLSQLIFNRARLLYNNDQMANRLIDMLHQLAADDFYDIIDIMQEDSVLRKWIDEAMESSTLYK